MSYYNQVPTAAEQQDMSPDDTYHRGDRLLVTYLNDDMETVFQHDAFVQQGGRQGKIAVRVEAWRRKEGSRWIRYEFPKSIALNLESNKVIIDLFKR